MEYEWTQLHGCDEACSGLAAQADDEVVTVGENGVINVLRLGQRLPLITVGKNSNRLSGISNCDFNRNEPGNTISYKNVNLLRNIELMIQRELTVPR